MSTQNEPSRPSVHAVSDATTVTHSSGVRRFLWLVVPVAMLLVYSSSFSTFPVLERERAVGFSSDAANYILLLRNWDLTQRYGEESRKSGRGLGDVAQKHKLHHVAYGIAGSLIYRGLRPVYAVMGLPPERAVFSVNAIISAFNVLLLLLLIRGLNPYANSPLPFLGFYALSLSSWLYGSVPGSWPLSGTAVLAWFLMVHRTRWPYLAQAALLGLFMLNNMTLAALLVILWLRMYEETPAWKVFLRRAVAAGTVTLVVWLGALSLLSLADGGFRPDRFIYFSLWFKEYLGAKLPITSLYVWKAMLATLFVTPIVANQGELRIPPESLLYTLQQSRIGLAATLVVVVLLAVLAVRLARATRARAWSVGWRAAVLEDESVRPAIYCLMSVGITYALMYTAGFTYSPTVVPLVALLLCRYLDLSKPAQRYLLYGVLAMMLLNNTDQVLRFREALRALS